MLSLANAFDESGVAEFDRRVRERLELAEGEEVEYVAETKLDGIAVSLRYEGGRLAVAATRGGRHAGRGRDRKRAHRSVRPPSGWPGPAIPGASRSAGRFTSPSTVSSD